MTKKQFKTAFVKMTRDPEKFAANLENTLNELTESGFQIIRMDYDAKKGTLIVGQTMQPAVMPIPANHPLATILSRLRGEPAEDDAVSPPVGALIHEVFALANTQPPTLPPESRITKAAEAVCRKHPNEFLRSAVKEIKKMCEAHAKSDHNGSGCDMTRDLTLIAETIDKTVATSVV